MGIISETVEIKLWSNTVKYYNDLGYSGKHGDIITVKVEDLPKGSHANIEVLCDMCKFNKMTVTYEVYNRVVRNTGNYVCQCCLNQKRINTVKERYGVRFASQSDIFKEKTRQTNLERYNVENVMYTSDIKEKLKQSNLEKYGVPCAAQAPEIREKIFKTLYKNGTQKTSRQQLYLHSLYGGKLNYPIKYYAADICFPEEKLVVEYDGGFHSGRVILGRLTQEEFDQKEIIRNNVIKRAGYKQMRIISQSDLLPSDSILLEMLSYARNYFSEFPNHSWIEFDIDSSTVRNAENKEGVFFNYGELRKIKDIDLNKNEEEVNTSTNSNFWNIKNTDLQEAKTA